MSKALQIDVDKILQDKSPVLKKWIPKFVTSWFKRFIHQEEMNHVLKAGESHKGVDFAKFTIDYMGATLEFKGLENIPTQGGCIIAANHPLGGLDGMALMVAVAQVRLDFKFLANDILMHLDPLKDNFIPVNKLGSTAKKNLSLIADEYKSGKAILIFPAGLCSRKIKGKIVDLDWQKSVIKQSIVNKLPIVPTYIEGENSKRFYRIANIRKWFNIKFNIEMFTLPDEMYKQKGKNIVLTFGKPIPHSAFNMKNIWADAQKVKNHVYQLKNDLDLSFPQA